MANKKIKATATLFLDFKNAKNDFSEFFNYVMQGLDKIETASDKMTVFKDMVDYVAKVDRALTALKAKNGDAFNSMFDGLDENFKKQLEKLFGIDGGKLGQLDVLREKLNTLTPKSSMDELREFASVIKDLYTSVGKTPPTLQFGDGHSQKAKVTYIQQLTDAVNGFATVWEDVNTTVSKGFGGNGSGGTGGLSKEIQEKIDKLKKQKEELQDVLNAINNPKKTKVSLSEDADEQLEQLKQLKQEFNNAKNAKETFEKSGLSKNELLANPEYLKSIAEYIKSAQKLQSAFTNSELTGKSLKWINRSGDGAEVNDESASVVDKFVNQHKEAVDKIKSYYADLVKDIDAQIKQLMSGSGAGGAGDPTKGTVSLYDKLKKSVEEYLEIRKQLNQIDKEKQPEENKRLTNRKSELINEIQSLKNISEDDQDLLFDVFDEADMDGADVNTIVEKFCNVLKIEIPQAATKAATETTSAFTQITKGANEASKAAQNVMYHLGNLLNGQGKPRDTFGDMAENLTSAAVGTRWEQYGFGALGGGLFGVSDPSTITQNPGSSTFIQSIDLSKYNMYMADTEERATALIEFLSKLQKFSMKSAEPNYTGFDAQLQDLDINALYDQAKLVFDQSELTKDQFETFINEMVIMLKQAGLAFDTQTGELSFTNLTKEISSSENISTRFMKMLGYHGVNVGGTSFDGLGQGSVLFDFDKVDIVGYFNTVQEAVEDYQKIINQIDGGNWVGSIEQLQQYAHNIDSIINKLTEAKNIGKLSGESGVDETLNKLTQIRKNIDGILTGKDLNGDNPFVTITTGSVETGKAVESANQKLREQEQLWENVKIAIKNGIGEAVGIDDMATALEVIEGEIKEGILTSLEECIARFREFNNISEEGSLEFVGKRERVIEDRYDTYLSGEDEVVSKEEADKLRQLSVQQEQLYQNLRSAIKGTLSDIVDVDDMTYAFDTIEKEIETGLLTTLDQCIERFKLLTGLDDKRLASIKDDQRVADSWDYYQGNRYVDDGETVIDSSEYNQLREDLADEQDRANQYAGDAAVAEDRADKAEARAAEAEARVLEVESDALRYQEAADRLLEEKSALQRENDELREQLTTQTDADHKSQLAQAEVAQLELLQQKLLEVKTAVDAKTQAFEEEYVTVDGVVDAEIASLQSLIAQLQEVVSQINLINDGFNNINTNAPKVELKSASADQSVATENIHYVTDPQGRPVTMYRGIRNSYSGLVSNRYHGGTFSTDNLELAKEYAGELGKVEKVLLSMKNPLEIDGHGAFWNQIEYIGDNSDEASKKLYELNASIRATKKLLADAENIPVSDQESKNILRGFITEEDTKRAKEISYWTKELKKHQEEKAAILADTSNPYGKKNTNELVEIAKAKGYDGVIFKNIIDSATGDVKDLSNVMVTFEQDQIHYIETIASTFESSITELKNHFGGLTKHISASGEEVEASIRKMVELRGKLNAGEISEDEYNAFISGNAIARDYKKLAKKSMAVPDFITGALDGDEFELKHVIEMINDMLDNMRHRVQKVAKAFGKEGVPLDQLLVDSANVSPITESPADEENVVDEVEQLNKLQTVLTEVKNAVLAKTKAFVDEGDVVGQVVGKEVAALMKLAETVDSIVPKVDALSTKMASVGPIDFVTKKDGGVAESGTTTEDKFKTRVNAKKGAITKYINDLKDVQYVTDDTRDELIGLRDALDTVKTPKDLNDIIAKFEKLQTKIGILKASFEKTGLNDIQNAERSLLGSFNTLDIEQKRELEPERDAVIKQLETYKNAVLNGQKVELQAIEDTVRALREKIEVYKQANKEANNTGAAQKKNSKFGDTVSRNATAKYNSLMGSANSDQFANSKEVAVLVGEYEKAYKAMIAFRNELRNSDGAVSEADEVEFKRLTTECNEYAKALDKLIKSTMKLKENKANPNDYMLGSDFVDNAQGRKQALTDFVKSVYDIDVAAEDFRKDWNEVVFAVDNGDGTFTQMTARLTDARNEIVALAGDTKKVQGKFESFIDGVKNRLQSLSQYFIATVGIYDVWNVIKQGINHVREIDTALTELKKVTDETDASYAQFLQDMSKTGSVIGATVKDLTTMASEWARLGYSLEEAGKLAESTAVLLNISEFDDATAASEALISTMQAFQYTADESVHVVDILNEVGNNYAVSSDGIATALQDSASALMEAGNNLEQSVALVAAANKVVNFVPRYYGNIVA